MAPLCTLKEVFETIGPKIQAIINSSLACGVVPPHFKHAVVKPPSEKPNLDTSALFQSAGAHLLSGQCKYEHISPPPRFSILLLASSVWSIFKFYY